MLFPTKPTTILIVEDEVILRKDIKQILKGSGYTVIGEASVGEQAIQLADKLQPDLVLMDIRLMGAMSGVEAAIIIRERNKLPVVFLTGNSDQATYREAQRARPYGYLFKPFKIMDLLSVVGTALLKHKEDTLLAEEAEVLSGLKERA